MDNADELLEQTVVWPDSDGRTYYVGELSVEQIGQIIAHLNRCHVALFDVVQSTRQLAGRSSVHPADRGTFDTMTWLHERPLYQRLLAEQRRRGS